METSRLGDLHQGHWQLASGVEAGGHRTASSAWKISGSLMARLDPTRMINTVHVRGEA